MTLGKVLTTMALMGVALTGIEAAAQVPTVWVIGDSTASNVDRRGSVAWPRATERYDTYFLRAGGRALMTGTRLLPGSAAGGRPVWASSSRFKVATNSWICDCMSLIFSRIFRMMSTPARL